MTHLPMTRDLQPLTKLNNRRSTATEAAWHRIVAVVTSPELIAVAAFCAIGANSAVVAADMAVKAPPPVVEVWAWDKFYAGLNSGYSWGRSDTSGAFYNNVTGVQLSPTQSSTLHLD